MQNQLENNAYAGFFVRFAAFVIDSMIAGLIVGIVKIPFSIAAMSGVNFLKANFIFHYSFLDVLGYVGVAAYFVLLTYYTHSTLGKKLFCLEVVSPEKEWTFVNILYRETVGRFLSSLLFVGYLAIPVQKKKQGFHDTLCDTYVVYKNMRKIPVTAKSEQGVYETATAKPEQGVYETVTAKPEQGVYETATAKPEQGVYKTATVKPEQGVYETATAKSEQGVYETATVKPEQDVYETATVKPEQGVYETVTAKAEQGVYETATAKPEQGVYETVTEMSNKEPMDAIGQKEEDGKAFFSETIGLQHEGINAVEQKQEPETYYSETNDLQ